VDSNATNILFEAADASVRLLLEGIEPSARLIRRADRDWEEIYVFSKGSWCHTRAIDGTYLCLPPGVATVPMPVEGASPQLLRAICSSTARTDLDSKTLGKPYVKPTVAGEFLWNEIPLRRAGDPGGRVAELSRNPSGSRVTSLMECRPGWILEEHDHPSDVLTFCLGGGGLLGLESKTESYTAGQLAVIPARKRHSFRAGEQGALLIIFVFEPFIV
jgi:quercetin dioxygenase-like cupin family protein